MTDLTDYDLREIRWDLATMANRLCDMRRYISNLSDDFPGYEATALKQLLATASDEMSELHDRVGEHMASKELLRDLPAEIGVPSEPSND